MNTDFANRVLLPDQDPTETAEQDRMQQLELTLLQHGQPVPVSPRDNHLIHLGIVFPAAQQVAQGVHQGQFDTTVLEAFLAHINEHYNAAVQQGVPKDKLAQYSEFVKKIGPTLAALKQHDAAAQQIAQAHQTMQAGGPGPAAPIQPPQAQPQ
jgi:hypothetical protein